MKLRMAGNKYEKEMKPTFFKVLIGDFSKQLRIPQAFLENFNGKSLGECSVKSPTGRCWFVNVEQTGNGLYFGSGWQDFVRDHCLEDGDFVIFKYYGNSEFKVKIYDKTCCEKIIKLEKDGNENGTGPISRPCKRRSSQAILDPSGSKTSEKKPVTKSVRNETRRSFLSFKSDNSCFVLPWTCETRKCYGAIPNKLARKKNLLTKNVVEITDPAGTTWVAELGKLRDGRLNMKGAAWVHFWKENKIKIGDSLVFEFTKSTAMQVHIFKGMVTKSNVHILRRRRRRKQQGLGLGARELSNG